MEIAKNKAKIQSGLLTGIVLTVAIGAGLAAFFLFGTSGTSSSLGPEFQYDIEQYAKIDPALITWRQVGEEVKSDFEQSRAIAVDAEGVIYIAGDEKLEIYDKDFPVVKQIELGYEPTCLGIDTDGTIIVGLTDHLGFMDGYGNVTGEWKKPAESALLTSVAVDKDNVYAADALNKVVWRYDREGNVVNAIGKKDPDRNIPGIILPSPYFDVAMYPDGLLRVVDPGRHLIEAYTAEGYREWAWGQRSIGIEGFSGCCNPVALAILPDGRFVTAEKGLVRVKVYDTEGEFQSAVAGPDQLGWVHPLRVCETPEECKAMSLDIAVGPQGRIYVLDTVSHVMKVFEEQK